MKLVINDFSYIEGGASKVAITQAIDYAKAGNSVIFFGNGNQDIFENLNLSNLKVISFIWSDNTFFKLFNMLFNFFSYFKLKQILRNYKIDDIYIHSWTKKMSPSIFFALKTKTYHMFLHDYFISCPNGGFYNFKKKNQCHLKPLSYDCVITNCDKRSYIQKIYRVFRQMIFKLSMSRQKPNYIFLNEKQKNILNSNGKLIRNKIDLIKLDNKIDFSSQSKIFYLGRTDPEKGISDFAKFAASKNYSLLIAGSGSGNADLEKFDNIELLGWLSLKKAITVAKTCRFSIFSSLWYEVDPLTPWELMSTGMPVLACNKNLFGQELNEHFPELVYNNEDYKDLQNKIEMLSDDKFLNEISERIFHYANLNINQRNKGWNDFIHQ